MDTPVVKLPRGFSKGVEGSGRPQEDTFQPYRERFDWFCGGTGLGVDFDDMGGVSGTVVFGEAGHGALLQLFDSFDFLLQSITDVDSEPWVFGVEDIPLGTPLEHVGVGFDEVFKSIDSGIELPYLGHMVFLSLSDCFE